MKKVLLALLIIVVGFAGYVATRPATFHIERSATIAAPAETIYPMVANFHEWEKWSPWEKLDPNMKKEYAGTDGTAGATYSWAGIPEVGEGRMTLEEATPPSKIGIKLEFLKPFQATDQATFVLAPEGAGTRVTWSMDGNNNYVSKAMGVFMNMDKMVGADFEKGLGSLRGLAEAAPPADSTATPTPQ